MSEAHYLNIQKSARYYLSGPLEGNYESLCFVLHGYGQLAKYFIRPFVDPGLSSTLFVAPEALHRFYLDGSSGRVGASWMTKEDRLHDIEDYCRYLDQLFESLQPHIERTGRVGILGFSQGVATACRWLTRSSHSFDYLVNYAGAFPPDLDHSKAIEKMKNIPVHLLAGDEDEYITHQKYQQHLKELQEKGFKVRSRMFEGKHRIYPEELKTIFPIAADPEL